MRQRHSEAEQQNRAEQESHRIAASPLVSKTHWHTRVVCIRAHDSDCRAVPLHQSSVISHQSLYQSQENTSTVEQGVKESLVVLGTPAYCNEDGLTRTDQQIKNRIGSVVLVAY